MTLDDSLQPHHFLMSAKKQYFHDLDHSQQCQSSDSLYFQNQRLTLGLKTDDLHESFQHDEDAVAAFHYGYMDSEWVLLLYLYGMDLKSCLIAG